MMKLLQNQKVIKVFRLVRPWVTFIIIFFVLRYTGILSSLTAYTSSALMKTGVMDVNPTVTEQSEKFNYNFTIQDLNGNTIEFKQFKNKTIFLNLWATWCGPCVAEMPSIESLYGKIDKSKVAFVILDWFEDSKKVSKFIKAKNYTFPVYLVNGDVPSQLNVPSIPTTFVISPNGFISAKHTGTTNYDTEEFRVFLEELKDK